MFLTYRRRFLFASCAVLAILLAVDLAGLSYSLYWSIWWYDIPVHIIGGAGIALLAAWALALKGKQPSFFACMLMVLIAGLGWEVFEAYFGLTEFPQDTIDTIKDLCDDVLGGSVAFILSMYFNSRS